MPTAMIGQIPLQEWPCTANPTSRLGQWLAKDVYEHAGHGSVDQELPMDSPLVFSIAVDRLRRLCLVYYVSYVFSFAPCFTV